MSSYAILAVLLVLGDQATKFVVRSNIELGGSLPFMPHIMDLTYVQNTGAAFSILRQHTWLLTLTSLVVVLVMCWLIVNGFFKNALGRWAATLVLAGGMGNLIDRAVFGFVTDMFKTTFIDFPVFNFADCCITVGVPLLFLYVWLYVGRDEKKEDEADDSAQLPPDGHGAGPGGRGAVRRAGRPDQPGERIRRRRRGHRRGHGDPGHGRGQDRRPRQRRGSCREIKPVIK